MLVTLFGRPVLDYCSGGISGVLVATSERKVKTHLTQNAWMHRSASRRSSCVDRDYLF